jgi:peptidoglycan/xylan/chitin deacetylase (PgdA/CDA1 family)
LPITRTSLNLLYRDRLEGNLQSNHFRHDFESSGAINRECDTIPVLLDSLGKAPNDDAVSKSTAAPGAFVISLDFELHWGVRDQLTVVDYKDNLLGVRNVVPRLLNLFSRYKVHATWATVGFLFFDSREALISGCPRRQPQYSLPKLSPYPYLEAIGPNEEYDYYHFAPSLIRQIISSPHQEVATHTFSHYYCLETGQNADDFRDDLAAAVRIASSFGVTLRSIVFPRNQVNVAYLEICKGLGLTTYRGNQKSWMYSGEAPDGRVKRAARLLDAYTLLSGHNAHMVDYESGPLINVPASRFLRPYSPLCPAANRLHIRRIRSDLSYAANHGLVYHLWWHPHNFGVNTNENLSMLGAILDHFSKLRRDYGMESLTMLETSDRALGGSALARQQNSYACR